MSRKRIDLTGQKFGRLTVVEAGDSTPGGTVRWNCACSCGKTALVRGSSLRSGHTRSCGCLLLEIAAQVNRRHGMHLSPEFTAWKGMWHRCTRPAYHLYASYGGRGIKVCEEWRSFEAFYADMGAKPTAKHSIDRINPDGNYERGNCRWATATEQQRNKRTNVLATVDGITASVTEHCERLGSSRNAAYCRLRKGFSPEVAVDPRPLREIRKELEKQQ